MSILPILLGVFLFLQKNKSSPLHDFLSKIDINEILSLLKEFGLDSGILSSFNSEILEAFKDGELDVKKLIPLAIKFFSKKKETSVKPVSLNPLDTIACGEIRNSMYSYLNA